MADVFNQTKRSEVMSRIRGRGNRNTEIELVKLFRKHGISGWRRHIKLRIKETTLGEKKPTYRAKGKSSCLISQYQFQKFVRPDFVFRRQQVVIFVDGCFWHGCPKHSNIPVSNNAFWEKKLTRNKIRDRFVNSNLRKTGWRIIRVWEHELAKKPDECIIRIQAVLCLCLKQETILISE